MSLNAQVYDQYKKAAVETVSAGKLLLMLYDGAVKYIDSAIIAINDKNINQAHKDIIRVQDIIVELMSTLNMDYEISRSLYNLYDFLVNRLIEANISKDTGILEEIKPFIMELRDTWQEVFKKQGNINTPNNMAVFNLKG